MFNLKVFLSGTDSLFIEGGNVTDIANFCCTAAPEKRFFAFRNLVLCYGLKWVKIVSKVYFFLNFVLWNERKNDVETWMLNRNNESFIIYDLTRYYMFSTVTLYLVGIVWYWRFSLTCAYFIIPSSLDALVKNMVTYFFTCQIIHIVYLKCNCRKRVALTFSVLNVKFKSFKSHLTSLLSLSSPLSL